MGQKINPTGFRLSVNRNWASKWYANSKNFPAMLFEDRLPLGFGGMGREDQFHFHLR